MSTPREYTSIRAWQRDAAELGAMTEEHRIRQEVYTRWTATRNGVTVGEFHCPARGWLDFAAD